jgi:uncharacterized protein YdaU (DUF1376 family)
MADLNVMPLYTDAFLADTTDLSDAETGSYLLLIMAMWRAGGSLPDDPDLLARIARVSAKGWPKRWLRLSRFFSKTYDSRWTQKKLDEIYRKAKAKRETFIENGRRGGRATALKLLAPPQAKAAEPPEQSESPAPPYLKPESLNPNGRKNPVSKETGSKPKTESLTSQRRKNPEEMTAAERGKLDLFEQAKKLGITGALVGRLYNAQGGDRAMAEAAKKSSAVLQRIVDGKVRGDKKAYIGAVIANIGKGDALPLESWDQAF